MLPSGGPVSEDVLSHVGHPTSGLLHHTQGVSIYLPGHLQPEEFLHLLQLLSHQAAVPLPYDLLPIALQIVVVFQVFLMKENITEALDGNSFSFLKMDDKKF